MTIKKILEQLEESKHPVAKSLHKGAHFNVLLIGFKKGMRLEEHKAARLSKLTVLQGSVWYREAARQVLLQTYDEVDIPIAVLHEVAATEDSICLLTQG